MYIKKIWKIQELKKIKSGANLEIKKTDEVSEKNDKIMAPKI
jgi:hypothetical protein